MVKKSLLIMVFLILSEGVSEAGDCKHCCKRKATLVEVLNPGNPDHDVSVGDFMDPMTVLSRLTKTFNNEYFSTAIPLEIKTEYAFYGKFEINLNEISSITGERVKSRFTLKLYYNGQPQELLRTWVTEKKNFNKTVPHLRRMFDNTNAETKKDRPIEEKLLWDFEKTPVKCTIKPEMEELYPDEEIEVALSNFEDYRGRKSRGFNRIVVYAEHGTILNGEALLETGYSAFLVGSGKIKLNYRASMDCKDKTDTITIYNSCNINDTDSVPLALTAKKDEIATQEIKVTCPPGTVIFKRTYEKNMKSKTVEKSEDGDVIWTGKTNFKHKTRASIRGKLSHMSGAHIPLSGQYWDYYQIENPSVFSFQASYLRALSGSGVSGVMNSTTAGKPSSPTFYDFPSMIVLIWDKNKKKLLDVKIPSYEVTIKWTKEEDYEYRRTEGTVEKKKTVTHDTEDVNVGRIKDDDDPLTITGGGKVFRTYEEEKTVVDEKIPPDGYSRGFTKETFTWQIFLE